MRGGKGVKNRGYYRRWLQSEWKEEGGGSQKVGEWDIMDISGF